MNWENLESEDWASILNKVRGFGTTDPEDVRPVMAVIGKATIELGGKVTRLSEHLSELNGEIQQTRNITSKYNASIIKWTKSLVGATWALALFALVQIGVQILAIIKIKG